MGHDPVTKAISSGFQSVGSVLAKIDPGPAIGKAGADLDKAVGQVIPGGWAMVGAIALTIATWGAVDLEPEVLAAAAAEEAAAAAGEAASAAALEAGATAAEASAAAAEASAASLSGASGVGLTSGAVDAALQEGIMSPLQQALMSAGKGALVGGALGAGHVDDASLFEPVAVSSLNPRGASAGEDGSVDRGSGFLRIGADRFLPDAGACGG